MDETCGVTAEVLTIFKHQLLLRAVGHTVGLPGEQVVAGGNDLAAEVDALSSSEERTFWSCLYDWSDS